MGQIAPPTLALKSFTSGTQPHLTFTTGHNAEVTDHGKHDPNGHMYITTLVSMAQGTTERGQTNCKDKNTGNSSIKQSLLEITWTIAID